MRRIQYILIAIVSVIVNVNVAWATDSGIYAQNSVLSSGKWVKIGVSETGINVITSTLIQQAGFSDMSKVKVYGYGGALQPDTLKEYYLKHHDDLQEIATYTADGKKYFFGQGPVSWANDNCNYRTRNPYSSYGCYFITSGDNPLSCTEEELLAMANSNSASHHTLLETDNYALVESGANLFNKEGLTQGANVTYKITVPAAATKAKLTVTLAASTTGTTYSITSPLSTSTPSGTLTLSGDTKVATAFYTLDIDLTQATKDDSGNYIVPVTISSLNGASSVGTLYIDFVSAQYNASNVPDKIAGNSFPSASYIYSITNQNHHADEARDLIVIIPPAQGNLTQAQALCKLHEEQDGITTRIIPADELYSEFSSGTPDISAFRRYLKMLYDRSHNSSGELTGTMPKWVLLFGKAYFDNRGLTGGTDDNNLLPVFETDDLYGSTGSYRHYNIVLTSSYCSDDYITVLKDGRYAHMYDGDRSDNVSYDIAVGRIPVSTNTEAKVYVEKIKHYMDTSYNGTWQRDIMFIGGNGNSNETDKLKHIKQIDENANLVINRHLGYDVKKVLSSSYTAETSSTGTIYPQAISEIKKQQSNGALIMDYGGHGSSVQLANEKLVTLSDFQTFSGKHYPVWITAACQTMPYDKSGQCIGLEAVKNADGGAIAFIGTSREVYPDPNTALNKTLIYHLLTYTSAGVPITLGEAMRRTKCCLVGTNDYSHYQGLSDSSKNKYQYNLVGDPALKINLPKDAVVIDEVNEEPFEGEITIKGLETVSITGHVTDAEGNPKKYSANTKAYIKVYDSTVKKECKYDSDTYSFNTRNVTLFEGVTKADPVSGQFVTTFRVPEELNNNDQPGQILFYVIDSNNMENTAKSESNDITFSGSLTPPTTPGTPDVYCYFNDKSFTNGSTVGATPFFVAELHDDEGLHVSESTGHNLELMVDGSADMTYDLNSNFTFDYNSYTTGQTWYVLPRLNNGYHTARFRVWNVLGTMVTKNLTFLVQNNKEPDLVNVFVSKNPAQAGSTVSFYVFSDMTGSLANIYIEIFDTSGRKLKELPYEAQYLGDNLEEKNYEDTRQYRSLTTLSWGVSGLPAGLYVYRVRMTCDGVNYASQSKKLLISY